MERMLSHTKDLVGPLQLLRAFTVPFVLVVGSGAVFLWLLCLLTGAEPLPIVGSFLFEALHELSPITQSLLCVWLSYTLAIYLPIAYFNSASLLRSAANDAKERTLSCAQYAILFRPPNNSADPALITELQNLLRSGEFGEPPTKWHPSTHPQLN